MQFYLNQNAIIHLYFNLILLIVKGIERYCNLECKDSIFVNTVCTISEWLSHLMCATCIVHKHLYDLALQEIPIEQLLCGEIVLALYLSFLRVSIQTND